MFGHHDRLGVMAVVREFASLGRGEGAMQEGFSYDSNQLHHEADSKNPATTFQQYIHLIRRLIT